MTPSKNYRDACDDVDEEFNTVILPQNDNIMPRVDPLDLGKESRDDYFRTDCRVLAIVAEIDIIIVGHGIIKAANPPDAAREAAAEVVVKYRMFAYLSEFPSSLSTFISVLENVKALGMIVEYGNELQVILNKALDKTSVLIQFARFGIDVHYLRKEFWGHKLHISIRFWDWLLLLHALSISVNLVELRSFQQIYCYPWSATDSNPVGDSKLKALHMQSFCWKSDSRGVMLICPLLFDQSFNCTMIETVDLIKSSCLKLEKKLLLQKTNGYDSMQVNAMVAGYKSSGRNIMIH
ncbi:hypothetical protein L6452_14894 [Arctium lappa]|uniref:Uncharacterized protein n=1 Tax=Arctium lappa TaxID=4217 RepID=A0ACB9CM53_ARCLA|nr:hypothetical protein L6452_14894 [Arctium lappa]